jgi:chromosome segregation ATPase
MTDLKRELLKVKDTESHLSKYILDLEARLAKADESILSLQQTIEQLENDSERRRAEVELLQSRLDLLNKDGASWRTDLEERERKLRSLELKMEEWERRKEEASVDRERLNGIVEDVAQARRSIRVHASTNGALTPQSDAESIASNDTEAQLASLQQTHAATLADLSSVTAKYRDALREISDLAAQIQEAKLSSPAIVESLTPGEKGGDTLAYRRRVSPRSRESTDHGKRLFFRQAASMESLHARYVGLRCCVL